MKFLIKLILLLCCFNVLAETDPLNGQVLSYNHSTELKYQTYQIDKKMFTINKLELLRTHETGMNTFEINTQTNEFVSLYFSNDCVVSIGQNSEFRVDLFSTTLKDIKPFPSKITIDSYSMNLALLDGEGYFSIFKGTNDQFILQTPVSNLGLESGKYYIQVTKKSVVVCILEGVLDIYDNITNKKETIKAGNMVLIHSAPLLSPKQLELFGDRMVNTVRPAKVNMLKSIAGIMDNMEFIKREIIFINIGTNIIGVKIK